MKKWFLLFLLSLILVACESNQPAWHLMLSHDQEGNVNEGSVAKVVNTIRNGCQHRIA